MTISASVTVQDGAGSPTDPTGVGKDVTPSATITIRLASTAGVDIWDLTVLGTDETIVAPTLSVNSTTKVATYTAPASTGTATLFRSTVTSINGRDPNTGRQPYVVSSQFVVHTLVSGKRVGAVNETVEANMAFGTAAKINPIIRTGGGGGSTPTGTGFRHVTSGTEDGAAALVQNADVGASAGIVGSKLAASLAITTSLSVGTTPASAGLVRVPNNVSGLAFHDNASGDIVGISCDSFNELIVGGDISLANGPQTLYLNSVSTIYIRTAGATALAFSSSGSNLIQFYNAGLPGLIQIRSQASDAATNDLTIQSQSAFATASTNLNGAFVAVQGGAAKTNGSSGKRGGVRLQVGADSAETLVEVTEPVIGNRVVALCQIGSGISSTQMPANTGDGVVYIANRAIVPSANAVGGGILYAEAGALKWRGSGGTITTVANA